MRLNPFYTDKYPSLLGWALEAVGQFQQAISVNAILFPSVA